MCCYVLCKSLSGVHTHACVYVCMAVCVCIYTVCNFSLEFILDFIIPWKCLVFSFCKFTTKLHPLTNPIVCFDGNIEQSNHAVSSSEPPRNWTLEKNATFCQLCDSMSCQRWVFTQPLFTPRWGHALTHACEHKKESVGVCLWLHECARSCVSAEDIVCKVLSTNEESEVCHLIMDRDTCWAWLSGRESFLISGGTHLEITKSPTVFLPASVYVWSEDWGWGVCSGQIDQLACFASSKWQNYKDKETC